MDSGEEVSSGFVVACGDGAELFEFGEEVLDQVSGFVEFLVVKPLFFAIGFGRDSIKTKVLSRTKLSSTLREHRVSCQRG